MQRRSWLALGLGAATVLAVGGGLLSLAAPAMQGGRLSPGARGVMRAIARAVLEGTLPGDDAAAMDAWLDRVETLVSALPPHAQSEFAQLLALLASVPGRRTLAGLDDPWDTATIEAIQAALQSMRHSRLALRRQAYLALHDVTSGAWFADHATWSAIGYPGPMRAGLA